MDFIGNRRKRAKKTVISNSLTDIYQHDLQLYNTPPANDIQLSEFEDLALERIQLLRILEQATQRGNKLFSEDWKECVYADLLKHNLKKFYKLAKSTGNNNPTEFDLQARRADHISHFILRLAHCRTEDLRKWFVARELEWFKLRYMHLTSKSIARFLEINNLVYKAISQEEKAELYQDLYDSTMGNSLIDIIDFYKVKFGQVATLVKNRNVFVQKGFAYIPSNELVTCIAGEFRTSLNASLAYAHNRLPLMDDDRINSLISRLHHIYIGSDFRTQNETSGVTIDNIDLYAKENFPLCMNYIYKILKQNHGLKYWCRLHFGLFIKGIGISYEDSMEFFRAEFSKRIDSNTFDKQYAYWIKHMYGKVGNQHDYSPYSCMSIINSSVGPGDHHGCPYKHWDKTVLKARLQEDGISEECVSDILDVSSKGHFQIACSKCFDYLHAQQNQTVINHPNQYFAESLKLKAGHTDSKATTTKAPLKSGSINQTSNVQTASQADLNLMINDVNWDEEMKME